MRVMAVATRNGSGNAHIDSRVRARRLIKMGVIGSQSLCGADLDVMGRRARMRRQGGWLAAWNGPLAWPLLTHNWESATACEKRKREDNKEKTTIF